MQELENNCHLFMCSVKRSMQDCVIKLRDNRLFKALLRIKKSFKSIDFDLAKHALVSLLTHPLIVALVDLILINQGIMKITILYSQ